MKKRNKWKSLIVTSAIGLFSLGVFGLTQLPAYAAQSTDFPYTGSVQPFTAPYSGTYELQVWGAQGGSSSYTSSGGTGGYSVGDFYLNENQTIYIYVGGAGSGITGGWNGGGNGDGYAGQGGGGGGATDVRTQSDGNWSDDLSSRLIVAGGGGGGGGYRYGYLSGGAGGGSSGLRPANPGSYDASGYGGTQSIGGNQPNQNGGYNPNYPGFGFGGNSLPYTAETDLAEGGGGGGYYGGSGATAGGAGGGGSGYIGGVTNAYTYAGNESFSSPSGGTEIGQSGNGYAIITLEYIPPTLNVTESPTTNTGGNVTLTATATANQQGSSISWIQLPNGNYEYTSSVNYTVSSNGNYTFTTDDNNGYTTSKTFDVTNIVPTFPVWTFSNLPKFIPSSTFPYLSYASPYSSGTTTESSNGILANGDTFYMGTFDLSQTESVSFSNLWADDYAQVYVDGTPIMQEGTSGGTGGSIPSTQNTSIVLEPGEHQVVVNVMNNDGFGGSGANPSEFNLAVTDSNGSLLNSNSPSEWKNTGVVTTLPSNWFNGANGTFDWTDYLMQYNTSTPIFSQQLASYTSSGLNVAVPNAPTINTSPSGWTNGNATFTLSGSTDSESGVSVYQYQIDGGAWETYTGTVTVTGNGTHPINARAVNNADGMSSIATSYAYIDTTAPTMAHSLSTTNWTNTGVTITESASDNESGVSRIVLPNGTTVSGSSATYTVTSNGSYTFDAYDNTGNENSDTVTISNIDMTPPNLSISETPTTNIVGNVTLTATASDGESGMNQIQLPNGNWVSGGSATYTVSANGNYTFIAEDNAGNTTSQTFSVSNILPPNNAVPTITSVTNEGNSALVTWGVPMVAENTKMSTNFDGVGTYWLYAGERNTVGDQSIVPDGINGSNALEVQSTWYTNGNADWWDGWENYQGVRWSRVYVPAPTQRFYNIQPGDHFSLTFQLKTQGTINGLAFIGEGGAGRNPVSFDNPSASYYTGQKIYLTQTAYAGQTTIYVDKPQLLDAFVHDPAIAYYSGNYQLSAYQIDSVNNATGAVTLNAGFPVTMTAGTELKTYTWYDGLNSSESNLNTNGQWETISMNMTVPDPGSNFSISEQGLLMFLQEDVPPGSIAWIDNIQYGSATQIKLYRDGQLVSMNSNQSYQSSYNDTGATDKAPPSAPTNIQASEQGSNVQLTWNPSTDYGTTYQYNVASVDQYGTESALSPSKSVTVLSGVAKYEIYSNGNLIATSTNTSATIPSSDFTNLTIVAVDGAGNVSTSTTIPTMTVTPSTTNWTGSSLTLTAQATDSVGIKQIQLPSGSWVSGGSASYTVSTDGVYQFTAVDNANNVATVLYSVENIDITPPSSPSISNNQSWTNAASVSVSITGGTDSQSGVAETQYELSGASNQGWTTYTSPFAVTNEGITTITARTIDNVGNLSATATSIVKIDRTAPTNDSITIVPILLNETP